MLRDERFILELLRRRISMTQHVTTFTQRRPHSQVLPSQTKSLLGCDEIMLRGQKAEEFEEFQSF